MPEQIISLVSVFAIICLIIIVAVIFIKKSTKLGKSILWFMLPVFFIGCILHGMAIIDNSSDYPWYYIAMYSMFSSFRMFGFYLSSNLIEELVQANDVYAIAVTLNYIIASMNTILVVLVFLFSNFRNEILTLAYKRKPHYIVLGNSHDAILLARDIKDNVVLIMDKNEELSKITKKYEKKGVAFLFGSNKEKLLKKAGIDKAKVTIISIEESNEMNLSNAVLIKDLINDSSKAYIKYDNIPNIKYLDISLNKNIKFFSKDELIASEFIFKNRLLKIMGKEKIDYDNNTTHNEMKHIFLGYDDVSDNLLFQLILNYQMLDKKFKAVIYTKNHDKVEQKFYSEYYAYGDINKIITEEAKKEKKEYYDLANINMDLEFKEDCFDSYEFKTNILQEINDFTFIYINYYNDKVNFDRAISVNEYLQTHGASNYHIFVRMREPEKYSAMKLLPKNITYFGEDKQIVSKQIIIDESLDILAKKINYYYVKKYDNDSNNKDKSIDELWNVLDYMNKESNRCSATSVIVKLNLMGLDLTLDSNAKAITEEEYLAIYNKSQELKDDVEVTDNLPRVNLGKLEHIRWNAFKIMNNNSPMKKQDVLKRGADGKYTYVRVDKSRRLHSNIASLKGILELENELKTNSKNINGFKDVDTQIFIKDFDAMDNLFDIIKNSGYVICKLSSNDKESINK